LDGEDIEEFNEDFKDEVPNEKRTKKKK